MTKKTPKKTTAVKRPQKHRINVKTAYQGFAIADQFGKPYIAGDTKRFYIYQTKTAARKARKGQENVLAVWIAKE